jgi:hypothetical protein
MATYLINIKLQLAGSEAYRLLEYSMKKENFTVVNTAAANERAFSYYGNQDLLYVNEAVRRAALTTGKKFSFTVIKDKRTEKQYHSQGKTG